MNWIGLDWIGLMFGIWYLDWYLDVFGLDELDWYLDVGYIGLT